jgi:hypothetical protein
MSRKMDTGKLPTHSKQPPRKASTSARRNEDNSNSCSFGYAFNFIFMQDYSNGILRNLNKAVVFEHLLSLGDYWLKKGHERFWHSFARLHKDTGISENTVAAIVKFFIAERFLTTEVVREHGRPITYYAIRYAHLATRMADIYGGTEVNHTHNQLSRIKQRKLALQRMARMKMQLQQQRRALLTQE